MSPDPAADRLLVRSHPLCLEHVPGPGHPEAGERLSAVVQALAPRPDTDRWKLETSARLPSEEDTLGAVHWLHTKEYVAKLRTCSAQAPTFLDSPDCAVSKGTFEAAVAAAGLGVAAALDLVNTRLDRCFLALRPPSHHAEPDQAKGYCYLNTVAIAAELVWRALGSPVLIVDFDVHHGNGTQRMFYDRWEIGYLSVHQYPGFPGTGGGDETGHGKGMGSTRNIPLAAGADDDAFASALEQGLDDMCSLLRPAVIVVSAGFDAHKHDLLGEMSLTTQGFRRMTTATRQAADTFSQGRVLSFLEGGFSPAALPEAVRSHVEVLMNG